MGSGIPNSHSKMPLPKPILASLIACFSTATFEKCSGSNRETILRSRG